jgi:hypothetical protein
MDFKYLNKKNTATKSGFARFGYLSYFEASFVLELKVIIRKKNLNFVPETKQGQKNTASIGDGYATKYPSLSQR